MAGNAVLTRDGPVPVPMDYVVPAVGELLPITVRATIDGSSASVAFYAALEIIAPSGRTMSISISESIAAGGSADVTWFPGALIREVTEGLPVLESFFLDAKTGTVTAGTVFASGTNYLVSVQGTVTDWNEDLQNGTPEANAMFPGALTGRVSTEVGIDPDTIFAYPNDHPQVIGHWTQFKINLGAGATHIEPFGGPYTTPQPDHFYTYTLTGQGSQPTFVWDDTPLSDNYGKLEITIYGIPGAGGSGTISDITSTDASLTVTAPTGPTTNLAVAKVDGGSA